MKKKIYSILFLGMLTLLSGCGVDKDKLSGEFIISGNLLSDEPHGIYLYFPQEDDLELLSKGYFGMYNVGIEYNNDKTRILADKYINGETYIIEYDIVNKEEIEIVKDETINNRYIDYLKYVPNSRKISYVEDGKLYVYDMNTGKEAVIITDKVYGDYSWDKEGEKLIYTADKKVYLYNIKTKESTFLFKGHSPVFSNNNEYIAYRYGGELIIHELETGEEWNLGEIKRISQHKFSPDDKYIAYSEQYSGIVNNPYFKIYVEDYKNGKRTLLLKGDEPLPAFDWK